MGENKETLANEISFRAAAGRLAEALERINSFNFSGESTAYLHDSIGILSGIGTGIIRTGQERLSSSLIKCYVSLCAKTSNSSIVEDAAVIREAIKESAANGLSIEGLSPEEKLLGSRFSQTR